MTIRRDKTVRWNVKLDDGRRFVVAFHPINDCPGFSHHVRILNDANALVAKDWLAQGVSTSKAFNAAFYINKHIVIKP